MEHKALFPLFAALAIALTACSNKPAAPEPMGESAPAFGSGEQYNTVAGFIEGRWSPSFNIDPVIAELLGLSPEEASDPETAIYWQFSSDGTFYYSEASSKNQLRGTWRENSSGSLSLSYENWNDESIIDAQIRFQKQAESGKPGDIKMEMEMENIFKEIMAMNYLELSEDGKKLIFTDPRADENPFSSGIELVRLQTPPD